MIYNNPTTIKQLALGLVSDGESIRDICPFCLGGKTREKSFSITRKGNTAVYICYRASCPAKGHIIYGGTPQNLRLTKNIITDQKYVRFPDKYSNLTVPFMQFMKRKYDISPALLKIYGVKQTEDNRILFPILRPDGTQRGDNVRFYKELVHEGFKYPKSMLYIAPYDVAISWHRLEGRAAANIPEFFSSMLIIVEDQVSAIKASRMVDSVALMGTNLSIGKIAEISGILHDSMHYKQVLILLDADAYGEAIRQYRRIKELFVGASIRRLQQDIKDTKYAELYTLLQQAYN